MAGRPKFEPTKEQRFVVSSMAACGFPQDAIAQHVGIDANTLRKRFRQELDAGTTVANAHVAQSLFKKALGTGPQSVTAAIWWEKTRAGKKDVSGMEVTGKDGAPLPSSGMTKAEFEEVAKGLLKDV